ncbi:AAA family ATPase [Dyella ginsengisoli]|uniref:AAA family ATPase n=1 Tax=Dyella ginsengisoli TaxID=363848 RepID=A0ABW8JY03_9GAMM
MEAQALVDQVRALKLEHRNFKTAYRRLYAQSALASPGQVIAVVGPTRVGKTTLSRRLSAELVKERTDKDERTIPLIRIEAATTNQGKFSTKHFTLRALEELRDPVNIEGWSPFRRSQSETHLRLQLERCIQYRKTRFLLIDEAHHLLRTPSQTRAGEILDTLKCLGNSTGLVIILFGGYELLQTCFSSAHLNGRLTVIDFPPYGLEPGSASEFDRILATFEEMLPLERSAALREHRQLIFEGSLGCIGLLAGWIASGIAEMAAQGEVRLTISHLLATRLVEQIRPIRDEIALGRHLSSQWGIAGSHDAQHEEAQAPPRNAARRPFERKPKRDPGPH